jgi:hypothetical protein
MAYSRKTLKEKEVDITGMILGATKRCKLPHCMGNPKDLHIAQSFEGYVCKECWVCHAYKPQITAEQQEKLDGKTITTDEAQLKKLEEAANKRVQKKVKTKGGEQASLF